MAQRTKLTQAPVGSHDLPHHTLRCRRLTVESLKTGLDRLRVDVNPPGLKLVELVTQPNRLVFVRRQAFEVLQRPIDVAVPQDVIVQADAPSVLERSQLGEDAVSLVPTMMNVAEVEPALESFDYINAVRLGPCHQLVDLADRLFLGGGETFHAVLARRHQ